MHTSHLQGEEHQDPIYTKTPTTMDSPWWTSCLYSRLPTACKNSAGRCSRGSAARAAKHTRRLPCPSGDAIGVKLPMALRRHRHESTSTGLQGRCPRAGPRKYSTISWTRASNGWRQSSPIVWPYRQMQVQARMNLGKDIRPSIHPRFHYRACNDAVAPLIRRCLPCP
jgi:hypothetical protein